MNWMINLTGLLLITTLTGSVAQILWVIAKYVLEQSGFPQWCYKSLWGVTMLYLVPAAFWGMLSLDNTFSVWGNYLFEPTRILINSCTIIVILWFIGMSVMGLALLRDIYAFHRLRRTSDVCEQWEQELFAEVCEGLQISEKKIQLWQNGKMTMPAFGGILHPVVIIPKLELTKEQLRAVLLHELIHYKQRISWLLVLARIVKLTQYFNPLVWRLNLLVGKWSEFDCDAKACIRAGGAKSYFSVITDVLEKAYESNAAMAIYLSKGKREVTERIKYMKKYGNIRKKSLLIATLATVFFVGVYSLTIVAAAKGAGDLYRYCYDVTVEDIEEGPEARPVLQEYTDEGPASNITILEDEGTQQARGVQNLKWSVPGNSMRLTSGFAVKAGQIVSVNVYLEPRDKTLKVGIVDSTGRRRYVLAKDSVNHDFSITSTDTYCVFVENDNTVTVQVEGTYNVR